MSNEVKKKMKWMIQEGFVKVGIPVHGGESREWLWCEPHQGQLLKVLNIPFFTDEVSYGDLITATGSGPLYEFGQVVEHVSTTLFLVYEQIDESRDVNDDFSDFSSRCHERGFHVEGMMKGYAVAGVPHDEGRQCLPSVLECAEEAGLIMKEYQEE